MSSSRKQLIFKNYSPSLNSLVTYYSLLKLSPSATSLQIQTAYRKEAAKCHNDKFQHCNASEKEKAAQQFQQLTDARDALLQNLQLQNSIADKLTALKKTSVVPFSHRDFVRNQILSVLSQTDDFSEAVKLANIVTKDSLLNGVNAFSPSVDEKLKADLKACKQAYKHASENNSSFNLADYPITENMLCMHYELGNTKNNWLSKLGHLSTEDFLSLIDAFKQSDLPIKETCLAFADISNDHEIIFEFTSGIKLLREHKLDNLSNIDALYQVGNLAQNLSNGLVGLHAAGLLTNENRELLIKYKEKSLQLGRGFEMVYKAVHECENWHRGFGFSTLNLPSRILTQNNLIRTAASDYPDGVTHALAELASYQRYVEQDLFTFANVNTIFNNARFMLQDVYTNSIGAARLFFKLRCNNIKEPEIVNFIFELSHMSERINEKIETTKKLPHHYTLTTEQMHAIFAEVKDEVKDDPVLQTAQSFLDILINPLSSGEILANKLSHIPTRYIIQLALACKAQRLNISESLYAASVLNKDNFIKLTCELNKIPLRRSHNNFSLFQQTQEIFTADDLHERIEKLKNKNNVITPLTTPNCSIM